MLESLKHLRNIHNAIVLISCISIVLVVFMFSTINYDDALDEVDTYKKELKNYKTRINSFNKQKDSIIQDLKWEKLILDLIKKNSYFRTPDKHYSISLSSDLTLPILYENLPFADSINDRYGTLSDFDRLIRRGSVICTVKLDQLELDLDTTIIKSINRWISQLGDEKKNLYLDSIKTNLISYENLINDQYYKYDYKLYLNLYFEGGISDSFQLSLKEQWNFFTLGIDGFKFDEPEFSKNSNSPNPAIKMNFNKKDTINVLFSEKFPIIEDSRKFISDMSLDEVKKFFIKRKFEDNHNVSSNGISIQPLVIIPFLPFIIILFLLYYHVSLLHILELKEENDVLVNFPYIGLFDSQISKAVCFIFLCGLPTIIVFLLLICLKKYGGINHFVSLIYFLATIVTCYIGERNFSFLDKLRIKKNTHR